MSQTANDLSHLPTPSLPTPDTFTPPSGPGVHAPAPTAPGARDTPAMVAPVASAVPTLRTAPAPPNLPTSDPIAAAAPSLPTSEPAAAAPSLPGVAVAATLGTVPRVSTDSTPMSVTSTTIADGDLPRLGSSTPTLPSAPVATAPVVPDGPTPIAHALADVDPASLPSLPTAPAVAPAAVATDDDSGVGDRDPDAASDEPIHPMAHLMPQKSVPSEASRKAAEARAAKKAKAKKVKLAVAAGFLVVAAVVGPPLFEWFNNALNEAGNTSTEEPAE
jgi:hypothetical protein